MLKPVNELVTEDFIKKTILVVRNGSFVMVCVIESINTNQLSKKV